MLRIVLPILGWAGLLALLALVPGCASPGPAERPSAPAPALAGAGVNGISPEMAADLERHWGVRVESLRLSAHGHIIDFRYRVLDPDKARLLADGAKQAYLINDATGERLKVPNMPKVGPLRSTAVQLERDRIYLVLFANPGARIKAGQRVSVEIGEFKAEHLVVE